MIRILNNPVSIKSAVKKNLTIWNLEIYNLFKQKWEIFSLW